MSVSLNKGRRFRLHTVSMGANGKYDASTDNDLHWVSPPTYDINSAYDSYVSALRDNMLSVMLEPGRNVPAYEIQYVQTVLAILANSETRDILRAISRRADFSTATLPTTHGVVILGEYILMSCEADNYVIFVTVAL